MEFHYVDLRCFCYATEIEDRVQEALSFYLPEEAEIQRSKQEGHHGDDILVLSTRLESKTGVRNVFDVVSEADGFSDVKNEIDSRVDEDCMFHIRMDKQAAYRGIARLGTGIDISAKAEAYPATREKALSAVKRSLGMETDT